MYIVAHHFMTSVFGKDESGSGWLTWPAKRLIWTHCTLSLFHFMLTLFSSVLITEASSKSDNSSVEP